MLQNSRFITYNNVYTDADTHTLSITSSIILQKNDNLLDKKV